MQWRRLYTNLRSGESPGKAVNPDAARTSYQRDFDRLIFSSAFRRLQNKTQVFPLPGVVFVHNRLTHSLEVASVGRSLGKAVGDALAEKYGSPGDVFTEFYRYELPSVIAAACLAHDIGNPPFGHNGEEAIRDFFKQENTPAAQALATLTEAEQKDFTFFEGNANALRTLAYSFNEREPGGVKLTLTTLAAMLKYPCLAVEGFDKKSGLISTRKSGFFHSEQPIMQQMAALMDIPKVEGYQSVYARHPFVYLTEAADDICYRIMDVEDAHRLKLVTLDEVLQLFLPFFDGNDSYLNRDRISRKLEGFQDDNQKVQYLRANWIGWMTGKAKDAFLQNEDKLLNGVLQKSLLQCLDATTLSRLDAIERFSIQRIYNARQVLEVELAGHHVIGGLLEEFIGAALHPQSAKARNLLQLIPRQFVVDGSSVYQDFQSITDFIAGMTDLYAMDLYRKIRGISVGPLQ